MSPELLRQLREQLPELRGRLSGPEELAPFTWFRAGGPAEVLLVPADEADLAYALARIPTEVPVTTIGLGSNLIVRQGGVPGVVVRLGRGFAEIVAEPSSRLRAGTAVPDVKVARAAADAAIDGLAFFRGIPGSIGGALRMNAGAHGGETRDMLIEARGVDRDGTIRTFSNAEMGFSYRHADAPTSVIFTQALFQGRPGDPATILGEMDRITAAREASQPIREKTGGSTFKNPARRQGLAIDRCGRLPRSRDGRRPGLPHALQLPDQSRPRHRCRDRGPGRRGPSTASGRPAESNSNGRSSASESLDGGARHQSDPIFQEQVLRKGPDIDQSWCVAIIAAPLKREVQPDGRIRFWGEVRRAEEIHPRVLRVVTLEDGDTVHNAVFDRNFRKGHLP